MPSGDRGYVPPPPPPSSNGDDIAAPILSDLFSNGLNTQAQPNREAAAAEAEVWMPVVDVGKELSRNLGTRSFIEFKEP
eukprot:1160193-Pelagomonas_calceolata.AAC.9